MPITDSTKNQLQEFILSNSAEELAQALKTEARHIPLDTFYFEDGKTMLTLAAYRGANKVVEVLLLRSAKVDVSDRNGSTALMYAASGGHDEIVRLLLRKGADMNAVDKSGSYSADICCFWSSLQSNEFATQKKKKKKLTLKMKK